MRALLVGIVTVAFGAPQASPPGSAGWVKDLNSPVVVAGTPGAVDDHGVLPGPVLFNGSGFQLWFTGLDDMGLERILYATSPDGVTWSKHLNNPAIYPGAAGSWDAAGTGQAAIDFDGGTYRVWYRGIDAAGVGRIGLATSGDGINFTKSPMNPVFNIGSSTAWDGASLHSVHVVLEGNLYRMWYAASNTAGVTRFGTAISPNGLTWTRDIGNPVFAPGNTGEWDEAGVATPRVIREGVGYRMWYTGIGSDGRSRIGYADSLNGVAWNRGPVNPVLTGGNPGDWDQHGVTAGGTLVQGMTFKMWFGGRDAASGGNISIGYATSFSPPPVSIGTSSSGSHCGSSAGSAGASLSLAAAAALALLFLVSRGSRR